MTASPLTDDQLNRPTTALVINFSGGKDSTAMLAYLCERYPLARKYVVHADTGFEHTQPVSAEDWSRAIVSRFKLDLHVVRARFADGSRKTLLAAIAKREMFPSKQARFCTSDLKRDPVAVFIRNHVAEKLIVNCTGERSQESEDRKKAPVWENEEKISAPTKGRIVYRWRPIKTWTEQEVRQYCAARELPLHPVYERLSRFSCRLCIFMSKAEIKNVYEQDPAAFEAFSQLEQQTGFTMRTDASLREIVGLDTTQLTLTL